MEDNNWPIVNPKRPGPPLPGVSQPPSSSSAPSMSSARPPVRSSASADHAGQQHQVPTTRVYVNPNFIAPPQQGDSAGTAQGSATASSVFSHTNIYSYYIVLSKLHSLMMFCRKSYLTRHLYLKSDQIEIKFIGVVTRWDTTKHIHMTPLQDC